MDSREAFSSQNSLTKFRKQVKLMRKNMGVTQKAMAKMLDISPARYSQIESGTRGKDGISLHTARRIAAVFDCTVSLSLVSFKDLVDDACSDQPVINSYGMDYSWCESELQVVNTLVGLDREKMIRDGCLDDPVGYGRMLLEEDGKLPPDQQKFRAVANRLAKLKGGIQWTQR